jgi:uncharacterized cupredoxin-like copper-binding protein
MESAGPADARRVVSIDSISLRLRWLKIAVLPAVIVLLASGCGAGQHSAGADGKVVRVSERDFKISAPKHASAGIVVFHVHNKGPDDHEFIVVRTRDGHLPLRADGVTANEELLSRATAGVLEPGKPGSLRELRLKLAPGRYMLICNMAGHYLGGMHAELVVS